ncbi:amino acid ABC transporter substrate-binding protein [Neorhizobium galegae]|uniref:amino acid ABC transporter substrate-binding protein n=1 Tax=Neorhizobium galegae TaxID=399 RepID=UPI001F33E013|nr:amino acid ABC transporter substrate-binding protein [Neorhizobium galegae]UIK08640.1 amino acid ABC transporter substrate-binding protein [Neorhizobium galegae]
MKRRTFTRLAALALAAGVAGTPAMAQEVLKVGAVAPKTGPLAGGAAVSYWPNVKLWISDVNGRGGLKVGGKTYKLEAIEYDDQTNPGETIKAVQRLVDQDKAKIVLPPYSTGLNLAAAPIYARYGLPMITSTATTDKADALSAQFPNVFITLGGAKPVVQGVVDTMVKLRDRGDIGKKLAMVNVADAFGIELMNEAKPAFKKAGFELVYETSYPLGTQDLSPVMKAAKAAAPDAFIAWSYPPDTFALTEQAIVEDLKVGAFFTAVATAFPAYAGRFRAGVDGVLGIGGVNADGEAFKAYAKRHEEVTGAKPDYWASAMVYSSFQVLEKSIEAVGSFDNAAIIKHIKANSFDTVIGPIKFDGHNNNPSFWTVGQWQGGVFKGVASTGRDGAVDVKKKAAWK